MDTTRLTLLGFDLAYLALLTQNGTKPLSRWEGVVPHGIEETMDELGLEPAYVRRRLQNGKSTTEFIFSKSEAHLDLYLRRFEGSFIDKSIEAQRMEGFLFGFPPCCVESFAHFGYQPNGLASEDQKLLFHWACPHCRVTPLLLPLYRQAHQRCAEIFAGKECSHKILSESRKEVARKVMAVASSLALVAAGAALYAPTSTLAMATTIDDPHWLPLPGYTDHDGDLLPDDDEPFLGMQPNDPDSDDNGILDGVQLSRAFAAVIDGLPRQPQNDAVYVEEHQVWGMESCACCGKQVNMGFLRVMNPRENQWIDLPYIALHYMECGGFGFEGSVNKGTADARVVKTVLLSDGTVHHLPIESDVDQDGLVDGLESRFGCQTGNPDSDGDGVLDGVQLARQYWKEIEALPREPSPGPYRLEHQARGIETCERCGLEVNMGYTEIINPAENYRAELPYISLHYLHHGSFAARGSVHCCEWFDPRTLDCVLHADGSMHQLPIAEDGDNDALNAAEETHFGTQPNLPDTDNDGVRDGVELGRALVAKVDSLPHSPQLDSPYRVDAYANGLERCEICGELHNMGFVSVINPAQGDPLTMPFIGLHAMRHGGFAYAGTVHDGRVDPIKLATLLEVDPTSVQSGTANTPDEFALWPCFPNPFNAATVIRYDLPTPSFVQLDIYNALGQKIKTLVSAKESAGEHRRQWDATNDAGQPAPSGVYLIQLQAGDQTRTHKVVVLR